MSDEQTRQDDDGQATEAEDSGQALRTTAEHWRSAGAGTPAEEAAAEVAEGAERGADQPDWGREGS